MEDCNKKITTKKKSWNWEFSRLQLFFNQMKEVSYYHCAETADVFHKMKKHGGEIVDNRKEKSGFCV